MKKICLVRTDLPQELDVFLNLEDSTYEIIVGRGTTLRCDDKRVSRNHCSLRVLPDGGILLVARHTNPCFYKVQRQSAIFTVLSRNESITLYQGDEFSLLPESFRYRYSMLEQQNSPRDPDEMEPTSDMLDTTITCIDNSEDIDNRLIDAMNETSPANAITSTTVESPPKRVLPDWLINLPPSNVTAPLTKAKKRKMEEQKNLMDKKQKNAFNETCRASTNAPKEQTLSTQRSESNDSLGVQNTEVTEAGPSSISPLPELAAEVPANVPHQATCKEDYEKSWGDLAKVNAEPTESTRVNNEPTEDHVTIKKEKNEESSGDSDLARVKIEPGIETQVDEEPAKNPVTIKKEKIKDEPVEEESTAENTSNPADIDQGASCSNTAPPPAVATREMCIYGLGCYRRNPQHRADLSHPGDPDYDADAENLPECEYGTSCYRKNVQHRRDFKHTKKMSPPPAPRPRPRPQQANSMAPNIHCQSCSIVYTVCTRCNGIDVHGQNDPVDLAEYDYDIDEENYDEDEDYYDGCD